MPSVDDRRFLVALHKKAKKVGFNIDEYNRLKQEARQIEEDLRRLRDPMYLHLRKSPNASYRVYSATQSTELPLPVPPSPILQPPQLVPMASTSPAPSVSQSDTNALDSMNTEKSNLIAPPPEESKFKSKFNNFVEFLTKKLKK